VKNTCEKQNYLKKHVYELSIPHFKALKTSKIIIIFILNIYFFQSFIDC